MDSLLTNEGTKAPESTSISAATALTSIELVRSRWRCTVPEVLCGGLVQGGTKCLVCEYVCGGGGGGCLSTCVSLGGCVFLNLQSRGGGWGQRSQFNVKDNKSRELSGEGQKMTDMTHHCQW